LREDWRASQNQFRQATAIVLTPRHDGTVHGQCDQPKQEMGREYYGGLPPQ